MEGRTLLCACVIIVAFLTTEGKRFKSFRAGLHDLMMADDPLSTVEVIRPRSGTMVGQCSCKCCEPQLDELVAPPCMNDIIVAVDSSACFRDHHRRMVNFLGRLISELHKSEDGQFGSDKTRLGIMQFSSDIVHAVQLSDYDYYQTPSSSKKLRDLLKDRALKLEFLGEGAFLNKALNETVAAFDGQPRPREIIRDGPEPRKIVILLTNGKSHPSVTYDDVRHSANLLQENGVIVYPVSVTRSCFGITSPDWDEGLCPDTSILGLLAKVGHKKDNEYISMRGDVTISELVNSVTDCTPFDDPAPLVDTCNNCTCDCELPIGPVGPQGPEGPKGDAITGPRGEPGIPGLTGGRGERGPGGPRGDVGAKGEIGPRGEVGAKGDVGEIGPRGVPGEPGFDGPPGPRGDTGPKGDTGFDGPIGPKGRKGEPGIRGLVGDKGNTGEKGDFGQKGEPGDIGPPGIGIKGEFGPEGPPGPRGPFGPGGDRGPKGDPGRRGLCGKPGPAGIPGPAGLSGLDGVDGVAGPPGQQGPRGPPGIAGARGLPGLQGRDGAPGEIGPTGPPGQNGRQGEPGEPGPRGADSTVAGPRGQPGEPGMKGEQGPRGTDGLNGFQGPPGVQGPRGTVGQKGEEGSINIEALRPMIVDLIRELMPAECGTGENGGAEPAPPDADEGDRFARCANSMTDIAFLIDGSSSVGDQDFDLLRRFLYDFVASFENIGIDGFRVSIIQYNESPRIELAFEESVNKLAVLNAIRDLQYIEGNTQTGLALETAARIFEEIQNSGERRSANQVVVVITDGRSQDDVVEPAYVLKQAGVTRFAVGVTDSADAIELSEIVSKPVEDHVYSVENYSQIVGIKETLLKKICSAVQGSYREPGVGDDEDLVGSGDGGELSFDVYG